MYGFELFGGRGTGMIVSTVEPAMSSHSYDQTTYYGRPLGHFPKWHFVYKITSYEQPPAWKATFLVSQGWLLIAGSTVVVLFAPIRGWSLGICSYALINSPCPITPTLTSSTEHHSSHQLTTTFLSYYNVTWKNICAEKWRKNNVLLLYYFIWQLISSDEISQN